MANADVLDILSDTLTPTNRGSANKDEIIREKVIVLFSSLPLNSIFLLIEKRSKKKYSSTGRHET
jgi:hypothetical protein